MSEEELGKKPTAIDPAASLAAEPDTSENSKLEEEQRMSDDQAAKVLRAPSSIPDTGSGIMSASFSSPHATVPEYIRGTLEQLHGINRFLHGRDVQKLQRAQVMKLTKELFDYQYKDMQHLLMLGMDIQKKTRFVQYLNATKDLQNRIQRESAESQLKVIGTMFENRIDAYQTKNARDIELKKLHEQGVIDKKQYEKSLQDNEARMDEHVQRLDQTAELLITRHSEFLYKTLELFKGQLIESGKI